MTEATPVRKFPTKVVGVTHNNQDGSSRQRIIAKCDVGDVLELVPQPDNPYDSNAVAVVWRRTGEQLGFLSREAAADITSKLAAGKLVSCRITDLTGGTDEKPTRGVNIQIAIYEPGTAPNDIEDASSPGFPWRVIVVLAIVVLAAILLMQASAASSGLKRSCDEAETRPTD